MKKKLLLWWLAALAALGLTLGLGLAYCYATPSVQAGDALPEDIAQKSYLLTGWKEQESFSLTLSGAARGTELALLCTDMNDFSVYANGERIFDTTDESYSRTHLVELPLADHMEIRIERRLAAARNRILIGSAQKTAADNQLAYGANMLTVGVYLLIAFYSLSLFLRKRSEKYLLLICALSVTALVSAFTNSNILPNSVLGNIAEPVRYFRIVFCAALCPILMGVKLPGKWRCLYSWQGIGLCTALLYALYRLFPFEVVDTIGYSLAIPSLLACAYGCAQKAPCARIFLTLTAVREGMRILHKLITSDAIPCCEPLMYYYLPQLSGLLFTLGCIIVVNDRFARKFNQVDELAVSLDTLNKSLDKQVEDRTRELKQANEELMQEQRRKHGMMLNIFHDLRTPIFTAQGTAEMLTPATREEGEKLELLKARLDYLEHMTEELFFLAKLEEGRVTFERFRLRLDSFCPPIIEGAGVRAEAAGLTFTHSVQPGLLVTADSYRLMQAIDNLLDNAIKYTPAGGSVDFSVQEKEGAVEFRVADNGRGIDPADLPNIFERYYQGKLTRQQGSTGLGLSIVKGIVDAHEGTVRAESEPGKGSVFTIALPAEEE